MHTKTRAHTYIKRYYPILFPCYRHCPLVSTDYIMGVISMAM